MNSNYLIKNRHNYSIKPASLYMDLIKVYMYVSLIPSIFASLAEGLISAIHKDMRQAEEKLDLPEYQGLKKNNFFKPSNNL